MESAYEWVLLGMWGRLTSVKGQKEVSSDLIASSGTRTSVCLNGNLKKAMILHMIRFLKTQKIWGKCARSAFGILRNRISCLVSFNLTYLFPWGNCTSFRDMPGSSHATCSTPTRKRRCYQNRGIHFTNFNTSHISGHTLQFVESRVTLVG